MSNGPVTPPLVDPTMFKIRRFVAGFSTDTLQSVTLAGLLLVVPLFLRQTLGLNALGVGVAAMIVVTEPGMDEWDLTVPLLIFGAGTGLLLAQVPNLTMSAVAASMSDDAAGVQNSMKELGTPLGTAIIGSVLLVATMTGVVVGVSEARGEPVDRAKVDQIVVEYEDALNELTPGEQQVFFDELDASVGDNLAVITEQARYDAMNTALFVLGAFVLLALVTAVFLPKGKLADDRHPSDPDAERFDKRAPYPERGT